MIYIKGENAIVESRKGAETCSEDEPLSDGVGFK